MPQAAGRSSETTLNLRVESALKAEFVAAAKAENQPGSAVLRHLMRRYVEEARRRRFLSEARRQSQLIAGSSDEAEVMRWMEDVSSVKGKK